LADLRKEVNKFACELHDLDEQLSDK